MKENQKTEQETRQENTQTAIEQIKEKFGEGAIMKFGEAKTMEVSVIPTGCLSLDIALGVGGVLEVELLKFMVPKLLAKQPLPSIFLLKFKNWAALSLLLTPNMRLIQNMPKRSALILTNCYSLSQILVSKL